MARTLSQNARARRYLQASMHAGYSGMPDEHREAYEQQMREHERTYPRVREHALAGSDQDFDEPLAAGEREHQRHLRRSEGLDQANVLRLRQELRNGTPRRRSAAAARRGAGAGAGPRAARAAASSGASAISAGARGQGGIVMQAIGIGLGLSLLYLLLTGKGVKALAGISKVTVGAAGAFIQPVDPIAKLESALGATPSTTASGPTGNQVNEATNPGQSSAPTGPAGQRVNEATNPAVPAAPPTPKVAGSHPAGPQSFRLPNGKTLTVPTVHLQFAGR